MPRRITSGEPSLKQAVAGDDKEDLKLAIKTELNTLQQKGCWEIVDR